MVDESHQQKSHGKAAIIKLINRLKEKSDCNSIYKSYKPKNVIVKRICESLGFKKTGEILHGEIVVKLDLS